MSIYPNKVSIGDRVGLVLPSSPITKCELTKVTNVLDGLNLKYRIGQHALEAIEDFSAIQDSIDSLSARNIVPSTRQNNFDNYTASGYLAGSPEDRAEDINTFFADDSIKAIWCLRGGYGSVQVVPYLDFELIKKCPKQFAGYSDITNLLIAINQQCDLITYHAPMITPNFTRGDLLNVDGSFDGFTYRYFEQLLMTDWQEVSIQANNSYNFTTDMVVTAPIIGGNLSELAWLMGTSYTPLTDECIIFIEEVRTHVVNCDMALTQLERAGFFSNIRGLIIGDFLNCQNHTGKDKCQNWGIKQMFKNHLKNATFPIMTGVKIGHDKQTATIPIGTPVTLDAATNTITIHR